MAALGYLLSGWLHTAIDSGLLSFLLVIWFFICFVGPGLNWSDTTLRLSAFYYYGTPLLHVLLLGIMAVVVVALVIAPVRFVPRTLAAREGLSSVSEKGHLRGRFKFGWAHPCDVTEQLSV